MPKDEKGKLIYMIGADLYDDNNNLKKVELKIEAKDEEEAFEKFSEKVKETHNGKFHFNGLFKIIKP